MSSGVAVATTSVAGSGSAAATGGGSSSNGTTTASQQSTQQQQVPVWRSVGEKSALRGYLAVLGVTPEASLEDIRLAYKKLALQWHPDRTDAPNARVKFQEVTAAYMALCVEEGDAQEIDVQLYETANHAQAAGTGSHMEHTLMSGLAGVTAGLAGVFAGAMTASGSPFIGLGKGVGSPLLSPNLPLNAPTNHVELYHPAGQQPTKMMHSTHCMCHPTTNGLTHHASTNANAALSHSHSHAHCHGHLPDCQCRSHSYQHSSHSKSSDTSSSVSDDVTAAVHADLAHSGLLPPPSLTPGHNYVNIKLHRPHIAMHIVFQVQMKIKKAYQLVYQGSNDTYTVPNLQSGTKYLFRVRACAARTPTPSDAGESEDESLDFAEPSDMQDESSGLGIYSQPVVVTTLGEKPEGNPPHPPVLSNIQLAAMKKKEKGKKKKATSHKDDSGGEQEESSQSTPSKGKKKGAPQSPSISATTPSIASTTASPLTTPKKLTPYSSNASASDVAVDGTSISSKSNTPATSSRKLTKKEESERRKREADEERQRKEQQRIEEEIAYQKFILEKREEAERQRLAEEQAELERYAKLKAEQEEKRKKEEEERKKREADEVAKRSHQQSHQRGRRNQQHHAPPSSVSPVSSPLLPTPPNVRLPKGKSPLASPSPSSPNAPLIKTVTQMQPLLHIKLKPEQQAAINKAAANKEPLLPTPTQSARRGKDAKEAKDAKDATAAHSRTTHAQQSSSSPLVGPRQSAWNVPQPVTAQSTPSPSADKSERRVGASPKVTPTNATRTASPILINRVPGKVWANVAAPTSASSTTQTSVHAQTSSSQQPLSARSPAFTPARSDSLSEHLNRFDATKPWQADSHQQQQHQPDMSSRFQSLSSSLSSSHQRVSTTIPSSTASPVLVSTNSSLSSLSSSRVGGNAAWSDEDPAELLEDLQIELERERRMAAVQQHTSDEAAIPPTTAWTAATSTQSLHGLGSGSDSLHFNPLSSLRGDFLDDGARGHALDDGAFLPPAVRSPTSSFFNSASLVGSSAGLSGDGSLGAGSFLQNGAFASASTSMSSTLKPSFSSLSSFPTTSGLSRDAPPFNPSSSLEESTSAGNGPAIVHDTASVPTMGGHTRRPLPANVSGSNASSSMNGTASTSSTLSNGLFNSFALPSFTPFSSFTAQSNLSSGSSSGMGDWPTGPLSTLPSSQSRLSATDSTPSPAAALFSSQSSLLGDDVLIPGGGSNAWMSSQRTSSLEQLNRTSRPIADHHTHDAI